MDSRNSQQPVASNLASEYAWGLIAVAAAAVISLSVSFQAGVFAIFFTIAAWWTWQSPVRAFFFWLVLSPLLPLFKVTQTIDTFTLLKDVIILTLFLKLFVVPLLRQTLPYRRNILAVPLLLLGGWTAVAFLQSGTLLVGILRAREIVLYALLYIVVLYLPLKKGHCRELLAWLAASFACVALLAAYQWFFAIDSAVLRFDPARHIWIPRLSSTFGHPSVFGEYLIIATTLCGAFLVTVKQRAAKLTALAAGLVSLLFIYLTYSRAVWLGLIAAGAAVGMAYVWQIVRQRNVLTNQQLRKIGTSIGILTVAGIIVLTGVWQYTAVGTFVGSAFDASYKSNTERLEFLARLIAPTTNTQAIVGQGLGDVLAQNFREVDVTSFDIASGEARSVQLAKDSTLVDNQHLKTFIEMGLIGLLVYGWIYWRLGKASWQLINEEETVRQIIGYVGLGTIVAFIVQGFFIDIWDIFPTNAYFWIIAGFVSRYTK